MGCFTGLIRFLFSIFTTLVCLVGLGMVGLASYWMLEYNYLNKVADTNSLSYTSIAVVILGVVLFFLGLLGCCGSCKKSRCLLYFFALLLTVLLLAQVAVVIFSFVEESKVEDQVKKGLEKTAEQFLTDKNTMKAWDEAQSNIECCGAWDGYTDWNTILDATLVPKSCCSTDACEADAVDCKSVDDNADDNKTGAQCVVYSPATTYKKGCGKKVVDLVKDNLVLVGAGLLVFVFLQVLGILSAIVIAKAIKDTNAQYA